MNTYLGLDISSTCTGLGVITPTGASYSLTITPQGSNHAEKLHSYRNQLQAALSHIMPTHVCIEDIYYARNINTLKVLGLYHGVAQELIYSTLGIEPVTLHATTIRAHLRRSTGLPTQTKAEVLEAINAKLNTQYTHNQYDITDALAAALAITQ